MVLDLRFFLFWIIISGSIVLGAEQFINPPDLPSQTGSKAFYPVFSVGDVLEVSWLTSSDFVDLVINQLGSPATAIDRTPNSGEL